MHQPRLSRKECDLPCRSFSAIPHAEKRTGFRLRMEEKKLPRLRDEAGRWTRRSSAMPMRERELPPATERQRGMQTLSSHPRTPRTRGWRGRDTLKGKLKAARDESNETSPSVDATEKPMP